MANLTCRHWKLSPISCLKEPARCLYAHYDTGVLGPPADMTCWAWKNGGCKLHEDGCLFSHSDSAVVQMPPTFRPASMTGKNLAIARAASKAGFDCSDVERLMVLVNAVRDADMKAGYPDYYVGQSKKPSEFYPARNRQRHHYRDLDNPAVPAFTLDATQIVRNIREWGTATFTYGYQDTRNCGNKRAGPNYPVAGAAKKQKTSSTTHAIINNSETIDLTKDDPSDYVHPSRRDRFSGANNGHVNNAPQRTTQLQRPESHEEKTKRITAQALGNISRAMLKSVSQISDSRTTLKKRWDADRNIQFQSVTDRLADLNNCFIRAEEALRDSVGVIQESLLKKY